MKARRLKIESAADAAMASVVARKFAQLAGLSAPSCAAFATAVSELVTNVVRYAGRGWVTLRVLEGDRAGVEAVVQDRGPGIADLSQAMREHVSTGGSLGLGLPGTKRLVDDFEIRSEKGGGTWVRIVKYR
ncbi:MAG TPA: ATP-binding protein [Polyangiaceae bacterium]